jgi:hypothetical protein
VLLFSSIRLLVQPLHVSHVEHQQWRKIETMLSLVSTFFLQSASLKIKQSLRR